jgi:hypothetical protein
MLVCRHWLILACAASCGLVTAGMAQDGGTSTVAHNCPCMANEDIYAQGELVCIRGKRMRCAMNQNISSWETTGEDCDASLASKVNKDGIEETFTPM